MDLVLVDAALLGYVLVVLVLDTVTTTLEPRFVRTHIKFVHTMTTINSIIRQIIFDVMTYAILLVTTQRFTQVFVGVPYVVHGERTVTGILEKIISAKLRRLECVPVTNNFWAVC